MPEKGSAVAAPTDSPLFQRIFLNTFYVGLWIGLSGTVILYNKWILAYYKCGPSPQSAAAPAWNCIYRCPPNPKRTDAALPC